MKIQFVDLKAQYDSIKEEITSAIQEVLDKTAFIGGDFVEKFENEFAKFCYREHAIALNSGTSALGFALKCLGICTINGIHWSFGDSRLLLPSWNVPGIMECWNNGLMD